MNDDAVPPTVNEEINKYLHSKASSALEMQRSDSHSLGFQENRSPREQGSCLPYSLVYPLNLTEDLDVTRHSTNTC